MDVALLTKDLDICKGELAEISAESWKEVAGGVKTMVVVDQGHRAAMQDGSNLSGSSTQHLVRDSMARIFIITQSGWILLARWTT